MHTGSEKGRSMFHGAEHICDMYEFIYLPINIYIY